MHGLYTQMETFIHLIGCIQNLYLWRYDADFHLLESNCPEGNVAFWNNILLSSDCISYATEHCQTNHLPILVSDSLSFLWIVVPSYQQENLSNIYVLGPVFFSSVDESLLENILYKRNLSMKFSRELISHFRNLPICAHNIFMHFGIMLYYCIHGEYITIHDIHTAPFQTKESQSSENFHGGGEYEEVMLHMVETGNLNYHSHLAKISYGRTGILAPKDSIRQFKDEIITMATLCSRAAIKGGLSREQALNISDHYIQNIEECTTISEVATVKSAMYDDFVQKVNLMRNNKVYSAAVKNCIDIIEQNLLSPITIKEIVAKTGYSGYYISNLFRKEMGVGIGDYLKQCRIEHAKIMLKNSNIDVSDIAIKLCFSSSSHFSAIFKAYTGMTPKEYRNKSL